MGTNKNLTVADNREFILNELSKGKKLKEIANSLGLKSHSSISNLLSMDDDFIMARQVAALQRIEHAEEKLEEAPDMLEIKRSAERLSQARWRAEREFSKLYGRAQDNDKATQINVVINRGGNDNDIPTVTINHED